MKQSPFVISMLLASTSALKFERPVSNDLIGIQYDNKNGVYRYAMPGPTQDDAKLAQSKTDSGMLESSKAALEEFSSIWDPISEEDKKTDQAKLTKFTHKAQKGDKTKDVVGPNNVDPVQAGYVNDHIFPEEGDPQFSYSFAAAQKARAAAKEDKSKDVVGPEKKAAYERGFVNDAIFPEEGDPQFSYSFAAAQKARAAAKEDKSKDVVGPNNVNPVQAGYVNDHIFPEEGDPQFSYSFAA